MTNADHLSSHLESDLSDPQPPSPADSSPTSVESEPPSADEDDNDVQSPISGSDEDAEGSDDEDFDMDAVQHSLPAAVENDRSSSTPEGHSRKRKFSSEIEDQINQNPELYGFRRSVCVPLSTLPTVY
jgi:chromodomain-helicase-DNA-binding protein 1